MLTDMLAVGDTGGAFNNAFSWCRRSHELLSRWTNLKLIYKNQLDWMAMISKVFKKNHWSCCCPHLSVRIQLSLFSWLQWFGDSHHNHWPQTLMLWSRLSASLWARVSADPSLETLGAVTVCACAVTSPGVIGTIVTSAQGAATFRAGLQHVVAIIDTESEAHIDKAPFRDYWPQTQTASLGYWWPRRLMR